MSHLYNDKGIYESLSNEDILVPNDKLKGLSYFFF